MNHVLSLAILNAVPIICWTVIAIHFDRWYFALFALLFGFSYKSYQREHLEEGRKGEAGGM